MGKAGKKKKKKTRKKKRHFFRHVKGHSFRTLLDFRPLHVAYGSVTIGASNPEGCEPGLDPNFKYLQIIFNNLRINLKKLKICL
jgi:hypothetical protein